MGMILSEDRIIDHDVSFYEADLEWSRRMLRTCHPAREEFFRKRVEVSANVLVALRALRAVIDSEETPNHGPDVEAPDVHRFGVRASV